MKPSRMAVCGAQANAETLRNGTGYILWAQLQNTLERLPAPQLPSSPLQFQHNRLHHAGLAFHLDLVQ